MGWQNRCEVDRRDLGPGWGGKSVVRWIAVIRATVGWQNPCEVDRRDPGHSGVRLPKLKTTT